MWCGVQPSGNFAAQARHRRRQFVATARRFAQPEGYVRWCAFGIFHTHAPGLHAQDAVAGVAELEHIAGETFDSEIFVHRADLFGLRFQHHAVVAGFGNGAAGGQRGHAGAAPCMQAPMYRIAMQIPGARTKSRAEAIAQHAHHAIEGHPAQPGERPRAPHQREQRIFIPVFAHGFGHDLLRQHVDRRQRNAQGVHFATADGCYPAARRIRPTRRGSAETGAPSAYRQPCARNARRVAGRWRSSVANRAGRPDRHRRYPAPAPAMRSPPAQ